MGVLLMWICDTFLQAHQPMYDIYHRQPSQVASSWERQATRGHCICLSAQTYDYPCLQVLAPRKFVQGNGACSGMLLVVSAGLALSSLACTNHVSDYQPPGLTGLATRCCPYMLAWRLLEGCPQAMRSYHQPGCPEVSTMLLVPAGLAVLESRAGHSSRAGELFEGAQEWQRDNVPFLHAQAQELRRHGNQEVRELWQTSGLSRKLMLYVLSWDWILAFL